MLTKLVKAGLTRVVPFWIQLNLNVAPGTILKLTKDFEEEIEVFLLDIGMELSDASKTCTSI